MKDNNKHDMFCHPSARVDPDTSNSNSIEVHKVFKKALLEMEAEIYQRKKERKIIILGISIFCLVVVVAFLHVIGRLVMFSGPEEFYTFIEGLKYYGSFFCAGGVISLAIYYLRRKNGSE